MSEWTFIDERDDSRRGWPEPNTDAWVAWMPLTVPEFPQAEWEGA